MGVANKKPHILPYPHVLNNAHLTLNRFLGEYMLNFSLFSSSMSIYFKEKVPFLIFFKIKMGVSIWICSSYFPGDTDYKYIWVRDSNFNCSSVTRGHRQTNRETDRQINIYMLYIVSQVEFQLTTFIRGGL